MRVHLGKLRLLVQPCGAQERHDPVKSTAVLISGDTLLLQGQFGSWGKGLMTCTTA